MSLFCLPNPKTLYISLQRRPPQRVDQHYNTNTLAFRQTVRRLSSPHQTTRNLLSDCDAGNVQASQGAEMRGMQPLLQQHCVISQKSNLSLVWRLVLINEITRCKHGLTEACHLGSHVRELRQTRRNERLKVHRTHAHTDSLTQGGSGSKAEEPTPSPLFTFHAAHLSAVWK